MRSLLLLLVFMTLVGFGWTEDTVGTYMIMAPLVMRPGHDLDLSVTILNATALTTVEISLDDKNNQSIQTSVVHLQPGETKPISLQVPSDVDELSYMLRIKGSGGAVFENETSIRLERKSMSIFIQTDKAMYKPSQKILFRAMAVYPDLMPYTGPLDIAIIDPNGNRIKQWLNQRGPQGVVSNKLQLTDQPVQGEWYIEVKANNNLQKKNVTVAEYVLPKFEVKVDLPSYYMQRMGDLRAVVTAKYTYGKPVEGSATVKIQLESYALRSCSFYDYQTRRTDNYDCPHILHKLQLKKGKGDIRLPFVQLLSLVDKPRYHGFDESQWHPEHTLHSSTILVEANVTEAVTEITLSGENTVDVKSNKYNMEFMDISPDTYKPKLTYVGFLKISQPDSEPPERADFMLSNDANVKVNVTFQLHIESYVLPTTGVKVINSYVSSWKVYDVPDSGVIAFTFNVAKQVDGLTDVVLGRLYITASVQPRGNLRLLSISKTIQKFKSQYDQGIQIAQVDRDGPIQPNSVTTFQLNTTYPIQKFWYELVAKGKIVAGEIVNQRVERSHDFLVSVSKETARQLSPSARLVVWCITDKQEVIADSLELNVDGAFAYDVSVSFDKNETKPAEKVKLNVSAYPGSHVGILAVDQSVLLLKGGNDITQAQVFAELESYGGKDSSPPSFGQPRPFRGKRMVCIDWCGPYPISPGGSDSYEIFKNADVQVLTDAILFKAKRQGFDVDNYYPIYDVEEMVDDRGIQYDSAYDSDVGGGSTNHPQPDQPLQKVSRTRTAFPETWLWSEKSAGDDGNVIIETEAPDTITSWVASAFAMSGTMGLGISATTSKVTVFKPFFVSVSMPYSVVRGEELELRITVFNYLPSDMQVKVTLEQSQHFHVREENAVVESRMEKAMEKWITVNANSGQSVTFWVFPVEIGSMPIEVKAQSNQAADAVRRMLLVEPEGVPQEQVQPFYLDLSEGSGTVTENVDFVWPTNVVPKSQRVVVTATGDMMGPTIQGLDSLVRMPFGCGEQNMLNFAPNIFVMKYLSTVNQLTTEIREKSTNYMELGYQRELTYQHKDGSFSAFGERDPSGSMWLTAFVLKCFKQARPYVEIDVNILHKMTQWMVGQRARNGSFPEPGRVLHTEMQGGSSKGISLTAFVLISLLEDKDNYDGSDKSSVDGAVDASVRYLQDQINGESSQIDTYTLAIVTYALTLAQSPSKEKALEKLNAQATVKDSMKYWLAESEPEEKKETMAHWHRQAKASNIELSSYVLLTYIAMRDIQGGTPVMRWLVSQRNANGGFSSTQDTVLALQALSEFAALIGTSESLNLEITVLSLPSDEAHSFDIITKDNSLIQQGHQVAEGTTQLSIKATGQGISLVQVAATYNVYEATDGKTLRLEVESKKVKANLYNVKACTRWEQKDDSGMALVTVDGLSGTEFENENEILPQLNGIGKKVEKIGKSLHIYMDQFPRETTCVSVNMRQVIPVNDIQKAKVSAVVYYSPDMQTSKLYIPEGCLNCSPTNSGNSLFASRMMVTINQLLGVSTLGGLSYSGFTGVLLTLLLASLMSFVLVL